MLSEVSLSNMEELLDTWFIPEKNVRDLHSKELEAAISSCNVDTSWSLAAKSDLGNLEKSTDRTPDYCPHTYA